MTRMRTGVKSRPEAIASARANQAAEAANAMRRAADTGQVPPADRVARAPTVPPPPAGGRTRPGAVGPRFLPRGRSWLKPIRARPDPLAPTAETDPAPGPAPRSENDGSTGDIMLTYLREAVWRMVPKRPRSFAGAALRAVLGIPATAHGYLFGEAFAADGHPGTPGGHRAAGPPNPLESYFDAHVDGPVI